MEHDEEWLRISQMNKRIAAFRDKAVDKWQRKTEVTSAAAVIKSKLKAFSQVFSHSWNHILKVILNFDDSEFYRQLLKESLETVDPTSSEKAFYALKRLQTKKRKIVDRCASKSRKIRYNVHEKIVNFMVPEPMNLPSMAPKLFENLFGLKIQKTSAVI
ncbi:hypothetical protein PTKIN_Ptkin10aG0145500 [Pterospermum kingtungense]